MATTTRTTAAALAFALVSSTAVMAPAAYAADAMRVVKDAATGELRAPTAAEAAAFEKAEAQLRAASGKQQRTPQAPVEIRYPDGTVETKLGEDTMMYSVVSAAADGTLSMNCLPAKEAEAFVKGAAKKPSSAGNSAAKASHAHP